MNLTIYHNPACSKSRKTLELIEEHGITPKIIEYLKTPPNADSIIRIARLLGISVQQMLRTGEADYQQLSAQAADDDEQQWAAGVQNYPRVLERPIVVDEDSARAVIGRPPENVLKLIDDRS